jgi:acyl-[acyl-carrier-protein]-phospholipid O-acyltransferase/long-chain-fatty-acid--[acyl-carrier-protein] ligase
LSLDNWRVQVGNRIGSVGLPLPGTSFRIVDPETYQPLPTGEAGMVLISGAQVMQGYLKNDEKTHSTLLNIDELTWYVTGDKGYIDEDGFIFILDRYSRFAKVGGEMVGLGTVELALRAALPDPELELVVVNVPDEKKGEKLVVLSNQPLSLSELRDKLTAQGLTPLAFPSYFFQVPAVPRLGSGKLDYAGAKRLALSLLEAPQSAGHF